MPESKRKPTRRTDMELYNILNSDYKSTCKQSCKMVKYKIEFLDQWENGIGEIVSDIVSSSGNVSVNYQQGVRRSCNFSVCDYKTKYLPGENSPFWYNRKFRLYIGIVQNNNVYWWSVGVFVTKSASLNNYILTVEGVDKFGLLDGSLNISRLDNTFTIPSGSSIYDAVQTILAFDDGNGIITDCIEPIIDQNYKNVKIQADITVENGQYFGEIITELANNYGADVYYDTNGHLIFHKMFGDNMPSAYRYMSHQWEFSANNADFINPNISYLFDGYNTVKVYTNNDNSENYSYTAINDNPSSPVRKSAVGFRRMEDTEIKISAGMSDDKCRQYAEYLLSKNTLMTMNISFNSTLIPHLDVNRTIGITEDICKNSSETFIVSSLTFPIGTEEMSVNATNIQFLPDFSE